MMLAHLGYRFRVYECACWLGALTWVDFTDLWDSGLVRFQIIFRFLQLSLQAQLLFEVSQQPGHVLLPKRRVLLSASPDSL